jgi:hypothetical protein
MKNIVKLSFLFLLLASCNITGFEEKAGKQFGDQHFKTAISAIELYNIRYKHYPESLDSLTFMGDWDKIIYSSVMYNKLDTGYQLDLLRGVMNIKPESLVYPKEFWQGLGIRKSNLLHN